MLTFTGFPTKGQSGVAAKAANENQARKFVEAKDMKLIDIRPHGSAVIFAAVRRRVSCSTM